MFGPAKPNQHPVNMKKLSHLPRVSGKRAVQFLGKVTLGIFEKKIQERTEGNKTTAKERKGRTH